MNGTVECKVCGSKAVRQVSKAYDRHHSSPVKRFRALNILLVVFDCLLIGLQPILVYMSKVDGKFPFSPVSVNFLTELMKIFFAVLMIAFQVHKQRPGEKSLIDPAVVIQAARANYLLAVPACLYAVNNYLKFIMQLYFNPATVKMLSNLKVLMIALLLRIMMRRRFTITQWEALVLLLIGISVNQLHTTPEGTVIAAPVSYAAYLYTLVFVTVPSMASVFNEYALKSQYETSVVLQSLFLYLWGAFFNCVALIITTLYHGGNGVNIFQGHSKATFFLIVNNGAQGVLSSFFFKYADAILKKYSSTVATIFTGLASAALFGHALTINFLLGVTIVFISMHQFFSSLSKGKDPSSHQQEGDGESHSGGMMKSKDSSISLVNMAAGAAEEASHKLAMRGEREPLLPT